MMAIRSVRSSSDENPFKYSITLDTGLYESEAANVYLVRGCFATRVFSMNEATHPVGATQDIRNLNLRKYNGTVSLSNK